MQRFKKFAMQKSNTDAFCAPVIFGKPYGYALAHPAASIWTGKYRDAAIGAGSNAGNWRAAAMREIANISVCGTAWHRKAKLSYIRTLHHNARRAGFWLP